MTRPLVPILLIVAPDHVAARSVARKHGLASDAGIADGVRTVTRASALACWHDVPALFFDIAFWPQNPRAQQLANDLTRAIQSGRLRLPREGEIETMADEFRERIAAFERQSGTRSGSDWAQWKTDVGRGVR